MPKDPSRPFLQGKQHVIELVGALATVIAAAAAVWTIYFSDGSSEDGGRDASGVTTSQDATTSPTTTDGTQAPGSSGEPMTVEIRGAGGPDFMDKCLDVQGPLTDPGTDVQIWTCNGSAEMEWQPLESGEIRGFGNNCLTVRDPEASRSPVQMFPCGGRPGQTWQFEGNTIRSDGGRCLDIQGGQHASGTPVQVYECVDVPQQQWRTTPTS